MRSALVLILLLSACNVITLRATRPAPLRATPALDDERSPGEIKAYWIGHSTVLVKLDDRWLITDPVFGNRLAGVTHRHVAAGIDLDDLPSLAWVLISHSHLDHLDFPSLARLDPAARLAVPRGALGYLPRPSRFAEVVALRPWASVTTDGLRITAVPARHNSGRWGIDELWKRRGATGWIVEYRGLTLYFAGDTAYDRKVFKEIRARFPHIDLALIPVGPGDEHGVNRWISRHVHVDPEQAMQILEDVGARWMIPIHHGTFFQSGAREERALARAIARHHLEDRVLVLGIGQAIRLHPRP